MSNKRNRKKRKSENRKSLAASEQREFLQLVRRGEDDPMRLLPEVKDELRHYFSIYNTTYVSEQVNLLSAISSHILQATAGTVAAVQLVPGGGKSTVIRALLTVFSRRLRNMDDPISKRIGGVIVVVEKSAEAHFLEVLCNRAAGREIAVVIEAPNDYNLSQGWCLNGQAHTFEECPRRKCPDYTVCPLAKAKERTQETPILILLHARYQRYAEDMSPFLLWYCGEQIYRRSLLLVDELPDFFEEHIISLKVLNDAETELDSIKPSFTIAAQRTKHSLLYLWSAAVRIPFFKLSRSLRSSWGIVTPSQLAEAGFDHEKLIELAAALDRYAAETKAGMLVRSLLKGNSIYFCVGKTLELILPRLKQLGGTDQPATFLFSGTAALSPEVTENPRIRLLPDQLEEDYSRLTIFAQRGDAVNFSKTGLLKPSNLNAAVQWLKDHLPEISQRHRKVLLVTHKIYAAVLWEQLSEFYRVLIPYCDGQEQSRSLLPYFGGLTGSNLYQEATCVIALGLNRFEPRDYLSRTLALDVNGQTVEFCRQITTVNLSCRLDRLPCVMHTQNITLARDLVQLIFRSALRRHGETQPIEAWVVQPPNEVLQYLQAFLPGCTIREIHDFSDACKQTAAMYKTILGKPTSASKLLNWMTRAWDGNKISPHAIREQTGLTQAQFKEAKKHPEVKRYFSDNIITYGSGKNTIYCRRSAEVNQTEAYGQDLTRPYKDGALSA